MKTKLLFLFLLLSSSSFSQGVNNLWLMGYPGGGIGSTYGIKMDFTSGSPVISLEYRYMGFATTNGIICDKKGNLLFYSNGIYVANSIGDTMLNGDGLNPCDFTTSEAKWNKGMFLTQANLIIPFPDDSTRYYLFHHTRDDLYNTSASFYLYYSVVDMTGDNGLGEVIKKNEILLADKLIGPIVACKHANGRDWWVMTHQHNTTTYFKYLVTPSGIQGPFIQNIGSIRRAIELSQSVFSPDGSKFAFYGRLINSNKINQLDIFDFDRCSGMFSNPLHLDIVDTANIAGVAFSSNSQVLYVSSLKYVYQFDMTSSDIIGTKTTVAEWDGYISNGDPYLATTFFLAQLAPDGRIYISCGNGATELHVINNPNVLGMGCDVCQHCIALPAYNAFTIPNHPNYFLGAETGSPCDSLTGIKNAELKIKNEMQVYPNPVSSTGLVTFTYPSTGEQKTISIFNTEGKEVARYALPQWSSVQHLKLPELTPGVYLARLTSDEHHVSTKFIVE